MFARGLAFARATLVTSTFTQPCRFKGHSKWQNIKHNKAQQDAKKLARNKLHANRIVTAIRENGNKADMQYNRPLAKAYAEAIAASVPKATLEKAIKSASDKNVAALKEIILEVRGPQGCMILVEVLAPNKGETRDINTILKKNLGILEQGVLNNFTRSASVVIEGTDALDLDKAEELAIEVGAEDVEQIDSDEGVLFNITCDPNHLVAVKTGLEKNGATVLSAESTFVPSMTCELSGGALKSAEKLINLISENSVVVNVHHNIESL